VYMRSISVVRRCQASRDRGGSKSYARKLCMQRYIAVHGACKEAFAEAKSNDAYLVTPAMCSQLCDELQ